MSEFHPDHSQDHCDHSHGQAKETVDRWEQQLRAGEHHRRIRLVAALALRAGSLLLCPGDDIAAIGLQLYGSVSGVAPEHRGDVDAILPERPEIQTVRLQPRRFGRDLPQL